MFLTNAHIANKTATGCQLMLDFNGVSDFFFFIQMKPFHLKSFQENKDPQKRQN